MRSLKKIVVFVVVAIMAFFMPSKIQAYDVSLVAPTGELQRGQTVTFTLTIDTQGDTLTSNTIGLNYNTQYLEFEGVDPGNTFDQVTATPQGSGVIIINGTSSSGFNGSGDYGYVKFKLIADGPGELDDLCAIFVPDENTIVPTTPPVVNPTTPPIQPTTPPAAVCRAGVTACVCAGGATSCTSNTCNGGLCDRAICQSCQRKAAPTSGSTTARDFFALFGVGLIMTYFISAKLRGPKAK